LTTGRKNINFIELDIWPPNSLNLNPVNYAVWEPFGNESTTNKNLAIKTAIITDW